MYRCTLNKIKLKHKKKGVVAYVEYRVQVEPEEGTGEKK